MVETIILAGGKSSRFEQNKMETFLNNKPILLHTVETFLDITDHIIIVTGYYDVSYLSKFIDNDKITIVHNESHELGMFSSIIKGISGVSNDVFIIPGDYPNIKKNTIEQLLSAHGDIRVPMYKGRKGHPIFISKYLVPSLKDEPIESNLKEFRNRHHVNYVVVDDEGVIQDVDFKEDLQNIKERNKDYGI